MPDWLTLFAVALAAWCGLSVVVALLVAPLLRVRSIQAVRGSQSAQVVRLGRRLPSTGQRAA